MATFPPGLHHSYAWQTHKAQCEELIRHENYQSICEIGGGRDPLFSLDEIASLGVGYTVTDVSPEELALVPDGYETLVLDVCDPAVREVGARFDLILSRMVAEHVPDGAAMYRNTFDLLRPGGQVFHFFPTLYSPVFILNLLLPERLTAILLNRFAPRPKPKFRAHYSLCRGPTKRMHRVFTSFGFVVEEYRPFYGSGYFDAIPVLNFLDDELAAWAARRGNPYLTAFAFLRLRKPAIIHAVQ